MIDRNVKTPRPAELDAPTPAPHPREGAAAPAVQNVPERVANPALPPVFPPKVAFASSKLKRLGQ